MQIISIKSKKTFSLAVEVLRSGGVIVYPTETAYALGCDATSKSAVERIFRIKQRDQNRALPLIVSSIAMAKKFAVWNTAIDMLAQKYWPGPLTLIMKSRKKLPVSASDTTIAIRVSGNEFARELSEALGAPIVSTSANSSGQITHYRVSGIVKDFKGSGSLPDLIIDAGLLPRRVPSTIIKIINKDVEVVRQGGIKIGDPDR